MSSSIRRLAGVLLSSIAITTISLLPAPDARAETGLAGIAPSADAHRPLTDVDVVFSPSTVEVSMVSGDTTHVNLALENTHDDQPEDLSWELQIQFPETALFQAGTVRPAPRGDSGIPPLNTTHPDFSSSPDWQDMSRDGERTRSALIIGNEATSDVIQDVLLEAGYSSVIVSDDGIYNGTNPSPVEFDLVIYPDGINYGSNMPTSGQTALRDYVLSGGGLITTEWVSYEIESGRLTTLATVLPMRRSGGGTGQTYCQVDLPAHPLVSGVPSSFYVTSGYSSTYLLSGESVISSPDMGVAVAADESNGGRVVQFGVAGNYSGYSPFGPGTELRMVLANAIDWVAGTNWLTASPLSGTVLANTVADIDLRISAEGLLEGDYIATLHVVSAQFTNGFIDVPVIVHVDGDPAIAVNPPQLDFGSTFVGQTSTLVLEIGNQGTAPLNITAITTDNTAFQVLPADLVIQPLETAMVDVSHSPLSPAVNNTTLHILSDDPLQGDLQLSILAEALDAPIAAIAPESVELDGLTGDTLTTSLSLDNLGGSDLDWVTGVVYGSGARVTSPTAAARENQARHRDTGKGEVETRAPLSASRQFGGPDAFGYSWMDSNTPGGPEFVWEDISGIGESLGLYGDDEYATVTLPFAFPYYGSMESTLNVSTNGYITFGDDAFEPLGDPFPDPVEPNGVIAPLWGDLANYEGSTYTWYDEDNARFIIQFNDYYGTYFSGFYTFQIVLEESGDILFNYDVIEDATDEFAIGIEDQNGFDGLTISYYSSYAQAGLAVRLSSSSAGHWLSVLPSSGTTGSSGTSVLELSATLLQNMLSGVYEATVVVASNDPVTPELQVPVTLTVTGAPQLVVDQQEINWGDVYIDHGQSRWLLLHNPGTADLLLDAQTDGNGFSVTNGTQLIPPFGSLALQLDFLTASAGQYNGLLTLASNDPQQGTVLVTLLANAIPAPEIAATPGSFDVTLDAGTMLSEDLVIDNLGGSSLDWQRQIRNLQVNSARSANIGFHANPATERPHPRQPHPADPGNPAGALTDQGDVLNYWDNFIYYAAAMVHTGDGLWVLGENSGGERDGEGSVGNENTLYLFDTDLGYEVFSFPVEPWTYSLAWDGQFLWVGADDGTVYGYDLNGNPVGDFSLPNFAWYSYQLVFDGQDFLVVYPDQYQIQRVDYTGAELEVGQYSDSIGYVNAVAWVPGHFSGHLWVFDSDYNDLVQLSNTLQNPEEVTRIDFLDVGWTRAMAHNGTNLLVANNWGEMWEVDDGQEEVDFFALDPVSGSVEPSSGVVAHMLFNSPGNFGGTVSADLVLQSNDPVQPELIVPLSLTVNGRPILGTDLVDLDFGSQYVGGSTSRVVRVRNLGSETLQISNIIAGLPDYTPSFTSVTLEPGLFSDLEIVFSPAQSGDRGTLLSLISNDPQQPIHDLTLSGTGLQAPELVVDPEVFTEWLASGTEGDYTLTVSNEGPGDLEYTVGFTQYARSLETRTPRAPDPELNLAKNERDPRPGQAPARGAGGPDSYGYTWRDSDEPNGPAYQWHDIVSSGEGVNLFLSGDDSAVSVTLPFAFPFYGNDYTTMWVSTNGYLTFGPNPYDYSNDPIPSTNQPNLFIAPFWDDLNGANNYWYWHDTVQNRVVIQYNNVAHLNGSGTYLMQAVLYSNGTIDYYYNTLNGTLTSCSVGIENIDGDDGLQVVYNAAWLHNDMAIRISATPGWLDVTPLAGTVAPGSSENLALHVNAQSLLDGAYDANIVVYSNDPLRPQATVPFHLTVAGFADIVVAQQSIDFGTVFTGSTNQLPVTVQNVGTGHLTLSALSTTGEGFSVEAAPIVIAPGFSRQVMVSFAPDQIGPVSGTLSIESDDEDTPLVEVVLAGNAEAPPVVAVSPASVTETIAAGETIELDLLVDNSMGATSLDWTIEVDDLGGNRFLLVREGRSAQRKGQTTAERDATWLTVEPLAGSVAPGQSQSLTMTIEAPLDYAGQYLGQIRVLSNDPVTPVVTVPVDVTVQGVPAIAYAPASIDFGEVFVGYSAQQEIQVSNIGSALLSVQAILSADDAFSATPQLFSLQPGESTPVTVTFTPSVAGQLSSSFNVVANDPDSGDLSYAVSGTGTLVPVMQIAPSSFASVLNSGESETQALTIDNTAGAGDLEFRVEGLSSMRALRPAGDTRVHDPLFDRLPGKDERDTRPAVNNGQRGEGGPDMHGYRWIDSDQPGGPAYDFVDIRNTGTWLNLTGDDAQAGVTLPFTFSFYGEPRTSALVSTNGYIAFTGSATSYGNQLLPSTVAPNDLIAAFWDDLHFRATGRVYTQYVPEAEKFIIQYTDIQRYSGTGNYTFQIILFGSGRIQLMFASMTGTLNSATTGIENASGTDGLTTAFNSNYTHNGLAVEYGQAPPWMTILPSNGIVPAGQSTTIDVSFNAVGYLDYSDSAELHIQGNDPLNPDETIPVSFTVVGDYSLLPGQAGNPVPAHNELQVNERPILSWLPASNAEYYQLYLWPADQTVPAVPTVTTANISWQVPTNLLFGTAYNWKVVSGNLYGLVEGPIWTFTVRTQPDLVVSQVNVPNQVFTEQEYEVSWIVSNTGAGATTVPSWTDRVYLSSEAVFDYATATYLGQFANASYLGSGESYLNSASFLAPQGVTGDFHVHVLTDVFNQLQESGEQNNTGSSTQAMIFVLTPPPDLVVSVVTAPTNGFSGQSFTVNWTVNNDGAGITSASSWYDAVYVAPEGISDPAQATYLGRTLHNGAMLPGASYNSSATVTMPLENFGSQNFIVLTDYQNSVFEHAFESNNSNISAPINVTLSPPADLAISGLSHPGGAAPLQQIQLSWTVSNDGFANTETGSWIDRVYLSSDNILDESDPVLASVQHSGVLEPGQSYNSQATVTWPDNISGERTLIVKTDANDAVFEHIFETNNVTHIDPVMTLLPDLVPIALSADAGGMSGAPLHLEWTIENQGAGGAFGDWWTDAVYISQQQIVNLGEAVALGTPFVRQPSLAAGASYSISADVAIPNGYVGTYYLHLVTDATNRIFEDLGDANNQMLNEAVVSITLSAWPNLQPAQISVLNLNSLAAVTPIEILYRVDNVGAGGIPQETSWNDRLYVSNSPVFNVALANPLGTINRTGPLDAGGDYSQYSSFPLPNLTAGNYYLHLVTDLNNTVYEHTNESDNVLSSVALPIASRPPSDLALSNVQVPAMAGSGEMITVNATVTNLGGATTAYSWADGIWFSQDAVFSPVDDQLVGSVFHSGNLANGQSYSILQDVRVPDAIQGDWHIFVLADRFSVLGESNTTNNSQGAAIQVSLTPAPDLGVTAFDAAPNAISGQPLALNWTIQNQGEGSTRSAAIYDAVYISQNSTLDAADVRILLQEKSGVVAPGDSYTQNRSVSIPVYLSGNYYLIFKSDSDDREYEPDKSNNRVAQLLTITQPEPSDLVVSSIAVPASAETGSPVTVSWVLENQGNNEANGSMCDGVYFSLDQTWDINDALIGVDCRTISIAPGGRMACSMELDISESMRTNEDGSLEENLPGLAPGDYYVIVRTDLLNNIRESDVSNNRSASASLVDVDMPELVLGVPEDLQIQDGKSSYYRVNVPLGEALRVSVNGDGGAVYSELYLSAGAVPTRSNYDEVGAQPYEIDQVALVPEADATTYYVLVYGNGAANVSSSATILAQTVQFSVTAVTPDHGGAGGRVTVMIEGARFQSDCSVALEDGQGNSASLVSATVLDPSHIRATFDLDRNLPFGAYDLVVNNPAREETRLVGGFQVEQATGADVSFGYSRPGSLRRFGNGVYQISVINNANNDIPVLSAILAIPAGTDYTIESDRMLTNSQLFPDSLRALFSNVPDHVDEQGWRLIPLNARDMAVGEVINIRLVAQRVDGDAFPLKFVVDGYTRAEFLDGQLTYIELLRQAILAGEASNLPDDLVELANYPDDFSEQLLAAYVALGLLSQDEVDTVSAADVSAAMVRVAELPSNLMDLGLRDLTTCQTVLSWLELLGRLGIIAIGLITGALLAPVTLGVGAILAVLSGLGLGMNIGALLTGNPGLLARIFCDETPVVASRDPNDIIGPIGFGDEHFISKNQTMPFMIRFENDPEEATAPAQVVTISQDFDSTLDLSSFRLGDFSFGPFSFDVPNNRAFYQQRLDVSDSLGILVDFTAGLDVVNHRAFWVLSSIDPNTGLAPEDPQAGFLAVNDSTGAGEGFVTYSVRPKSGSLTGETIVSEARIIFDENEPIDTPEIFHTVDAAGGTSMVTGYPAVTDSVAFTISWEGQDDEGGSGVASWDVYRSVNASTNFELYQVELRDTATVFVGSYGNTYNFFTIARDNVGNTEAMKHAAEASVFVSPNGIPLALDMPDELTLLEDELLTLDMNDYVSGGVGGLVVSVDPTAELTVEINGLDVLISAGPDWNGSELVNFVVSDGAREIVSDFVMIIVQPVNDPPAVLMPLDELVILEDASDCSLDLSTIFGDVDGDDLSYTVEGAVNLGVEITGSAVCITPAPGWSGNETLTFFADDGVARTAVQPTGGKRLSLVASRVQDTPRSQATFAAARAGGGKVNRPGGLRDVTGEDLLVTVLPQNDAPVITLPEELVFDEDQSMLVDFLPFVSDEDNALLTLSVLPTTHIQVVINDLMVTLSAPADWNGSESVIFRVDDGARTIASDTTLVVVNPVNDAPLASGLPDTLYINEDSGLSQVDLNQYFSDVDGDPLSYLVEGAANLQVSVDGNTLSLTPAPDWFGSESLLITADDVARAEASGGFGFASTQISGKQSLAMSRAIPGKGGASKQAIRGAGSVSGFQSARVQGTPLLDERLSASGTLVIMVSPVNDAPVIDLPPTIAFDEDTIWQQDFSTWISDVDSGSLGLSASGANELAVTVAGLDVSIVPPANWNGSECIVFFVDDFEGRAIASDTLCVTVLPVNDDPTVAMSLDTLTIQEGGFDESIDLNQIFTDLDGDLLAFSVSGNVNLAVEISGSGLVRIESTSAFTGEELLVFTAEDGQGRTASWKSGILQPSRQKARGKGATVADDSRASVSEDLLVIVTPQSASGGVDLPVAFALEQNYPNPFNPTTLIRLAMPETGPARVTVHDMTGRLVAVLHDGILSRGSHEIIFDGAGLPSGIYIYRAEAVGQSQTRKMMLVK